MAVAIRLSRGGAKKRPYYRIVVSDTRSPRDEHGIDAPRNEELLTRMRKLEY